MTTGVESLVEECAHLSDVETARAVYLGPDTEHVTREDLLWRVRFSEVTVLDVRPAEEYAAGHIPGAVSIPLDKLAERLADGMLEWRLADLPIAT